MISRMACFYILMMACSLFRPSPVYAQAMSRDEIKRQGDQAADLAKKGKYTDAAAIYERVLPATESVHGKDSANTIAILAEARLRLSRPGTARQRREPLYLRSLKLSEAKLGKDHLEVATTLNNIGNLYYSLQQYATAEPYYARSLTIREAKLGKDHVDVATTLGNLAQTYRSMALYDKAEPLLLRALGIREAKGSKDHADLLRALDHLASLYKVMGKPEKMAPLQQRILTIHEGKFGKDHLTVAADLLNLADTYYALGQFPQAEPLFQRCVHIRETKAGTDDLGVATSLNKLALTYQAMIQYAKAEPCFLRSLSIRQAKLARDHALVAVSLTNLGTLYTITGQYSKAEPLFLQGLQIREAKFGKESVAVANSLHCMGELAHNMDRPTKAEALYLRSLNIRETKLGKDHPDVATSLNNLGNLYGSLGQYAKAEPLYDRGLQIREAKFGKDHPLVATSLNNVALFYMLLGQYAKAEPVFLRSLSIREAKFGKEHLSLTTTLLNLGALYHAIGQDVTAEVLFQRSLRIRLHAYGKDHPNVAICKNNLGNLYAYLKRYDLAEEYCLESIRIWEANGLSHHTRMGIALSTLAGVYQAQKKYDEALKILGRSEIILLKADGPTHPNMAMLLQSKAKICWAMNDYEQALNYQQQALEIYRVRLGKDHPKTNHAMSLLANFLNQTHNSAEAMRTMDRSLRSLRIHTAQTLPMLPESEQMRFIRTSFQEDFLNAASLALNPEVSAENRLLTAGWILNGKSIIHQALVERLLLVRDSQSADAKRVLGELEEVRRRLARSNLRDPAPSEEIRFRKEIDALREKEKVLEKQLHAAGLTNRQDPWIEIDELRRKLPSNAIYVDFLRFAPTDKSDLLGRKPLAPIYVAWISSRDEDTVIVNLGSADKIDSAIRDARQEMQKAHEFIRQDGEVMAEKRIHEKLAAVARLILEPLLPQLSKYPHWILGPDGNLWLIPWACLPLDDKQYVIEKHTLRYVTSGRDLVLNPLQLDQKATSPVIFADPDFDLDASKLFTHRTSNLRGESGLREAVSGKRLPGQIEDWHVDFEFRPTGQLIVHDKDTKGKVGEGSWKIQGQQLIMTTEVSRYEGAEQGNRIAGQRTKRNDKGAISRDRWHLDLPPDESLAWLRDTGHRTMRSFGKVARLPGTAAEADAIAPALAKLAHIAPRRFLEANATVAAFQRLKGPRVLVMSTHGYFLPDQEIPESARAGIGFDAPVAIPGLENPLLRSGLLLAGCNNASKSDARQDTGILTGLEIVGTDLRGTELVVLSACETGLGDIRNGEGVVGLRQAFHLAGAQAVVASLWKIPDRETAILMKTYFEKMSAGGSKVDALRDAQLTMLRERRDRNGAGHPFYWAAFTLTGR